MNFIQLNLISKSHKISQYKQYLRGPISPFTSKSQQKHTNHWNFAFLFLFIFHSAELHMSVIFEMWELKNKGRELTWSVLFSLSFIFLSNQIVQDKHTHREKEREGLPALIYKSFFFFFFFFSALKRADEFSVDTRRPTVGQIKLFRKNTCRLYKNWLLL